LGWVQSDRNTTQEIPRKTSTLDPNPVLFGMEAQNRTKAAVSDKLYISYKLR